MENKNTTNYITSAGERRSYAIFFLGQNLIWGFIGYISTFLTDIGISAAKAAAILIIPKVWDAVNDPIMGIICDRIPSGRFGRYRQWFLYPDY